MNWGVVGVALAAMALGAAAADVDMLSGGNNRWRALDLVLNAACVWAGVGVLAGRVQKRAAPAARTGAAGLFLTVLAYYVVGELRAEGTPVFSLSPHTELWLFAAAIAGPPLGMVGLWTRRRDLLGLAARLVVPAAIFGEEAVLHPLATTAAFTFDPWLSWTQAAMVIFAVVWALASIAWWRVRSSPARSGSAAV